MGGRWYAVVLGPYAPNDAEAVLRQLRNNGSIPADSYIVDGRRFQQQYYPIGVGAQTAPQPLPSGVVAAPTAQSEAAHEHPEEPEEIVQDGPGLVGLLDRNERRAMQVALRWAGFYDGPVDGLIGRTTRAAMREWQQSRAEEPNGALNITQRETLLAAYNSALDGVEMQLVRADVAGIEMMIPTQIVAFAAYEPPFARFAPVGGSDVNIMLISQLGDRESLSALFKTMQSSPVGPATDALNLGDAAFEIDGISDDVQSYTYARLENGAIKGFSLHWPAGDAQLRRRILDEMQASFTTFDAVLPASMEQ